MSSSLKISLMYLLLIIPQHGNSPLPVVDSWLKKDQDDGFVQRDMTSSLTGGDESFGSAHQTYQNSLIRKKKSDSTGTQQSPIGYKKFTGKFGQNHVYSQPDMYFDGRYISEDYNNAKISGNEKNDVNFEDFDGESGPSVDRYSSKMTYMNNQNDDDMRFFNNKLKSGKYMDMMPGRDVVPFNARNAFPDRSMSAYDEDAGRSAKWSLCKRTKEKYTINQPLNYQQTMSREARDPYEPLALRHRFAEMDAERRARELNNQYKEALRMYGSEDGRNPQMFGDSEYYDVELNPASSEDDVVMAGADYDQMLPNHGSLNKRDGSMQMTQQMNRMPMAPGMQEPTETAKAFLNAIKASKENGDMLMEQQNRQAMANMGMDDNSNGNYKNPMNADMMWNFDNMQNEALRDVVRNSQKALKEVQFYQQKLAQSALKSADPNANTALKRESRSQPYIKWDNKMTKLNEKRLKREDEDEQKNMKTGTDEGGGGEYEDEEGKGHKDEEEYYEDADLSNDESSLNGRHYGNFNQKYVKREVSKGANLKNPKETQNESESSDYEFNIENAPVENSEKSRKTSLRREGEKEKNTPARRGVKVWDQWGKWSPCSVTCGVGRSTRWRHCIGGGCAQGEKEAQIKRCTNPAC